MPLCQGLTYWFGSTKTIHESSFGLSCANPFLKAPQGRCLFRCRGVDSTACEVGWWDEAALLWGVRWGFLKLQVNSVQTNPFQREQDKQHWLTNISKYINGSKTQWNVFIFAKKRCVPKIQNADVSLLTRLVCSEARLREIFQKFQATSHALVPSTAWEKCRGKPIAIFGPIANSHGTF